MMSDLFRLAGATAEFTRCGHTNWYRNRWDTHEVFATLEKEFVNPVMQMIREFRLDGDLEGTAIIEIIGPAPGAGERADRTRGWDKIAARIDDRKPRRAFIEGLRLLGRGGSVADFDQWEPEKKDMHLQVVRWILDESFEELPVQRLRIAALQFGSPAHQTLLKLKEEMPEELSLSFELRPGEEVPEEVSAFAILSLLNKAKLVRDLDVAVADILRNQVGTC
jgi:hypothetical protein